MGFAVQYRHQAADAFMRAGHSLVVSLVSAGVIIHCH
jgi:hypothetical protein